MESIERPGTSAGARLMHAAVCGQESERGRERKSELEREREREDGPGARPMYVR